jgi:hypothetical protein
VKYPFINEVLSFFRFRFGVPLCDASCELRFSWRLEVLDIDSKDSIFLWL